MKVGAKITVFVFGRPRRCRVTKVEADDCYSWETPGRHRMMGVVYQDDEGIAWTCGHDGEATTAMLAARALAGYDGGGVVYQRERQAASWKPRDHPALKRGRTAPILTRRPT